VQGSSSVLQIGCGNSNLGEQLHDSCGIGTAHHSAAFAIWPKAFWFHLNEGRFAF